MKKNPNDFVTRLRDCPLDELCLLTPEYLTPYLNYIRDNQRLFRTGLENAATLRLKDSYAELCQHVLLPILERYGVPAQDHAYQIAFYIHGLMAIITEWLKNDCADSIEHIIAVMHSCVRWRADD